MHIPDGYLSPSTCVALFGAAAPFWLTALNRVKRMFNTRMIPLLSVFAAFAFVIMMFNLPLPGGTTSHAVGVGIASIVLGPWSSILAISVALVIQAVFFGDGGITAIGANCFNMAIVGSLVAYAVYRILGRGSPIGSARRVVAAGLGGYIAINAAALCAAIEFGIQPLLFRDASGSPLYAPYGLNISIPAMLAGHLTFAGLAELVISSGLMAWLQRVDPSLLRLTAPDAPDRETPAAAQTGRSSWPPAWKLWLVVGILVILTPLGILAAGGAWGEWGLGDFANPPRGLARLAGLWTAPLARYAPGFISNPSIGYLISAVVGVALIIALGLLVWWFSRKAVRHRANFIERTLRSLLRAFDHALFAEQAAERSGLLQRLNARVKLIGIALLIFAAVALHQLSILGALFGACVLVAMLSRISFRELALRVWIGVLAFTGLIALPAILLLPGGLRSGAFLILRAETAATLAALLILCTPWAQLLRALRWFRIPAVLVAILGMTYRYVFLLLKTAQDMFEAREARLIGVLEPADRRRLAASSAGLLLSKTIDLGSEVHSAMQARGYRGEVRLLDEPPLERNDWLAAAAFLGLAGAALWLGR